MKIVLDLDVAGFRLEELDDLGSLCIVVEAPADATTEHDVHRLGDVIDRLAVGALRPDGTASVNPELVRFLAAGQVDEQWEADFTAMLESARQRHACDDEGRLVVAVRWLGSDQVALRRPESLD